MNHLAPSLNPLTRRCSYLKGSVPTLSFAAATMAHRLSVSGSKTQASLDFDRGRLEFESAFDDSSLREHLRFAPTKMLRSAEHIKRHFPHLLSFPISRQAFGGVSALEDIIVNLF